MENFNEEFNLDESVWDDESLNGTETLEYEDDEDESYAEYDDDDEETYMEYDDDDDEGIAAEYDDDDDEASPELLGGFLAGKAISGISKLLRKRPSSRIKYGRGRRPGIHRGRVVRIPSFSNLRGMLRTPRGKSLPIRLPKNVATKKDVLALRRSVSANRRLVNGNTKRVGKVIGDLKKARAHVIGVDKKHTAASKAQNRLIGGMNKKLVKVDKAVDKTKEQLQMNQLLSMFMTPQLEEFTVKSVTDGTTDPTDPRIGSTIQIEKSKNKDNNLGLMMAMSGGLGGDSGMNPMMYYFMFNN